MHFLTELVKTPELKDPFKNHLNIHRHFYRYSKGEFIGPALKITKSNTRITMKGSHEYEDLILEIVANTVSEKNFEIKGTLISGKDINDVIMNLGFDWKLAKSKGDTKNYKATILSKTNKDTLIESIEMFRENCYFLISFNINPTCKVTTKKNVPQPSKKKVEEDDVNKRVSFCTGVIDNTENNLKLVLDLALSDFKEDIPNKWKTIILKNNYKIADIELPEDVNNWALKRIMATRKGRMTRSIEIDNEYIEKQYSIIV